MISLFDRELMRMEQEVRDLKTIHQRGLGTVKFFDAEISTTLTSTASVLFQGTIASGEPANPLAISLVNFPEPIDDLQIGIDTVGLSRWVGTWTAPRAIKVKFISSSQLSGITQS